MIRILKSVSGKIFLMLNKIIEQINNNLNIDFFPKDLSIEDDRFYAAPIYLTKRESIFLKNILEEYRKSLD